MTNIFFKKTQIDVLLKYNTLTQILRHKIALDYC